MVEFSEQREASERSLDDLTLSVDVKLEELAERPALGEMAQTFYELFRVPLRILSEHGGLIAEAGAPPAIYGYLGQFPAGRRAVDATVAEVLRKRPAPGKSVNITCVTGALYHVVSIALDGRSLGRVVLGPFLPPEFPVLARRVLELDPEIQSLGVEQRMAELPRAKQGTVQRIANHLQSSLDLILFSGHKALLTGAMHLASVRESFRELKETNLELQNANESLKQLDRLKSNFLATVSHELRTPLTSIIGYSEMLAQGIAGSLSAEQQTFVETIHEKGQQLLEMISGLLDMSKLDSGTLTLRKEDVDMGLLVRDVLNTFAPIAKQSGVEIRARVDPAVPPLRGDGMRLRQVFTNLVDNALKFTPQGERVELSVEMGQLEREPGDDAGTILLAGSEPAVVVTVADSGIGVPDEEKQRIFDPFYQVDGGTTRRVGGTGLGLAIVRRLVEGHEGVVVVRDRKPRGAEFVVTLPLGRGTFG